jgi:hypothetical protein
LPAVLALLRAAACRRALARCSAGESGIYACRILPLPGNQHYHRFEAPFLGFPLL